MKWQLLAVFVLLGFSPSAGLAGSPEAISVDAICGKLVSAEDVREQGTTNALRQERKPLAHTRVQLFSPTASADCCELVTPVAEVRTARDGSFQFKKPAAGDYWLVATVGRTEYKLLVRYQPVKKGGTECPKLVYVVEKGKLQLRRTETLTAN